MSVFDPHMFRWWAPEEWREKIFDPAAAVPRHHVVVLVSDDMDDEDAWLHTRGMRKFGRPDLSVHDVPDSMRPAVIDLFERFIEHQAFGMRVPEGQPIRMAGLPEGMTCHHRGDIDDPDFNNVHLEICWPD